ncbi:putative membrane protein [Bacillus clarus]|uniref:Putative membrane protein n=1 Tax=Bacillus clarus TaxID=2338372 RepID=A0A090YA70_9BACI|nr:putative membrane protein [Bacillus clarus]
MEIKMSDKVALAVISAISTGIGALIIKLLG